MVFRPTARWNPYRTAMKGRLPVLGGDATRGWRARHVRAGGGPRCTARPGPDATGDPMRHTVAYAWYRFRRTMRSEMSYFLSVILLVGAVGGLALGAIEAARSTESSFTDLVASSRVPQLFVFDGVINPGIGLDSAYNPRLLRDAVAPARRGAGREHGRAQPGPADPPGEAVARAGYFPRRRGECRRTRLQRGSHQNRRRADGRSSRGGRGRARCGQRQDVGLPRRRGDPGGMGDQRSRPRPATSTRTDRSRFISGRW